ncbi:MAG: tRNA dihydrouridine synthase DusB [Candidatus Firestonebacteria bacterium]|nr:tRNA dihydrouridine synthase DusB [Candidatus Firestonebacteria bacterium]
MHIGSLQLEGLVVLAPLAGIGNLPFRLLCRKAGAAMVFSEMMSCHGLLRKQPNTWKMLAMDAAEKPLGVQLFGAVPEAMAAASVIVAAAGADAVDLNFGCPAPKVVRHRGGSALLKEPELLQAIVAACVQACPKPVTVKIRAGWDDEHINAVEIARRALTVHGRTRAQKFGGKAEWKHIADVVRAVRIPVMGNGDVTSGPDAKRMLDETGCAAVMVGRAAMGRPWVFTQINHYLKTGEELPEPSVPERVRWAREHHAGLKALKGERTARLEMRKHTAWYWRGVPGAAEVRRRVNTCETEAEYLALLDELEQAPPQES